MKVFKRDYTCTDFKYDGTLITQRGAFPTLTIGFAIQNHKSYRPELDVIHDLKYNNFDASVSYVVNCITKVSFNRKRPDENEIWEEIKLQSIDVGKLLIQECTSIKKNTYPAMPDIEQIKEKILKLVRAEIDELYPLG